MPALHYQLRWPDASVQTCYSPSLVIKDFLEPHTSYPLPDFLQRLREATQIASDRVEAKFGFVCSRAMDNLAAVEETAQRFTDQPQARIEVLAFQE